MRRRDFIMLLGGAAAASPLVARAQQPERMRRVGILMHSSESEVLASTGLAAFTQALGDLGWVDGRNLRIDTRYSDGNAEGLAAIAKQLVGLQPDVLFCRATPPTTALFRETKSIPIVFIEASDPIGSGFAASLARPGGNVTGFTNYEASVAGKWLELLKEIAPGLSRAAVIFNPETAVDRGQYFLRTVQEAADKIRLEVISMPFHTVGELEAAVAAFAREPGGGLVAIPDLTTFLNREQITALAIRYRLPAVYSNRYYIRSGGLISYGVDSPDLFRRAAAYVARILKGEKPGDLPVQAPTKFELIVNLKIAKAIGLTISESFLLRADEVIE
jgi:putative ABC transport system substrate-binding protein